MAIDLPPNPGFRASEFGLETNTQRFESPITKAVQRVLLGGGRWTASYTIRRMRASEPLAAQWITFFLQLEGSYGTFNAYDPDRRTPRGVATGTPLVKGGSQTGSTLAIDGCTADVTGWLKAGDYFAVSGELKQLTADANTNGSGEATLSFKPPLRSSPADNAALTTQRPTCTMTLVDDQQAKWRADMNGVYEEKSFSAIEVFS